MWKLIRVFPGSEKRSLEKIKKINSDLIEEEFIPVFDSANEIQPEIGGLIFIFTKKPKALQIVCSNLRIYLEKSIIPVEAIKKMKESAVIQKEMVIHKFKENDEVQIIGGNFPGLIGRILELNDNIVKIVISIFGEDQIMEISKDHIVSTKNMH